MSSNLPSTIKEAIKLLRNGYITPREICHQCIKRAERLRELNAFVTETHDIAKEQAERSTERFEGKNGKNPLGLLDGIPISIKDNFSTEGVQTTCGSRTLDGYIPPYHATVVNKMLREGAILMGKTNMDSFAMGCGSVDSYYGPVRNPWHYNYTDESLDKSCEGIGYEAHKRHGESIKKRKTRHHIREYHSLSEKREPRLKKSKFGYGKQFHQDTVLNSVPDSQVSGTTEDWRIAGGSSGGSAVAVATRMCFASLGSDTGGSTRLPAAFCGVVGLKASYGLLSRNGLIPLVNSLDVPGIFARCVDDAAIVLNTIAGPDHRDSTTIRDPFKNIDLPDEIDVTKFHIGIPKEYHATGLSADVLNAWKHAVDLFENAGARVSEVSLPHTEYSLPCYSVISTCEIASNMARYDGIEYGHRANVSESTDALYAATRHEGFNEVIRGRSLAGNYFLLNRNYEKYFVHAMKVRRLIADDFRNVFNKGVNVLLTPTALVDAPVYKDFVSKDSRTQTSEHDVFTQAANLAGIPAISVPTSLSSNSLPIGMQFIGSLYNEKQLLTVAKWFEQQVNAPRLNIAEQIGL